MQNSFLNVIKEYFKKEGLYVFILHIINFFFFKLLKISHFLKTPHHRRIIYLNNLIKDISKNKIISGPYKDTFFDDNVQVNASFNDYSSKFIGVYELQIQKLIIQIQKKYNLKNLINLGAGDGYHIISQVKNNYFSKGIAFEINKKNKQTLIDNLLSNNIYNKVTVLDEGNFEEIKKIVLKKKLRLNETLFLIDIEGGEFSLFDSKNIRFFKDSFLIIEDHSMFMKGHDLKIKTFYSLIKNNFKIKIINNNNRDPNTINELKKFNDDDRWLMMSEGRGEVMWWILLCPK